MILTTTTKTITVTVHRSYMPKCVHKAQKKIAPTVSGDTFLYTLKRQTTTIFQMKRLTEKNFYLFKALKS